MHIKMCIRAHFYVHLFTIACMIDEQEFYMDNVGRRLSYNYSKALVSRDIAEARGV